MKHFIVALFIALMATPVLAGAEMNNDETCFRTKEHLEQFAQVVFCVVKDNEETEHILVFSFEGTKTTVINDFLFHTSLGEFLPVWGKVKTDELFSGKVLTSYIVKIPDDMLSLIKTGEKFSFVYMKDGKQYDVILTDDQYDSISLTAMID